MVDAATLAFGELTQYFQDDQHATVTAVSHLTTSDITALAQRVHRDLTTLTGAEGCEPLIIPGSTTNPMTFPFVSSSNCPAAYMRNPTASMHFRCVPQTLNLYDEYVGQEILRGDCYCDSGIRGCNKCDHPRSEFICCSRGDYFRYDVRGTSLCGGVPSNTQMCSPSEYRTFMQRRNNPADFLWRTRCGSLVTESECNNSPYSVSHW